MINRIIKYVIADIGRVFGYLPDSIFIGMILVTAWVLFDYFRRKDSSEKGILIKMHLCSKFLFLTYLIMLLKITFLSREPGSRNGIDWMPFSTWEGSAHMKAFVIENVIMFIPFGLLLPIVWKKTGSFRWIFFISFCTSLCIEVMQGITKRGFFQTDDIITNVIGGILGFLIWHLFMKKQIMKKNKCE